MKTNHTEDKIEAIESDYLYINPSQIPNAGSGLFTAIAIYKGENVAVFKGKILTNVQAIERGKVGKDKYFILLLDGTIMDCMHVKCFAKYANDAKGSTTSLYKNNTKITLDDNNNVCIAAIRNIKANEELFCSYGKEYWKKHS